MTTTDAMPTTTASPEAITDEVRARYAEAALSVLGRGEIRRMLRRAAAARP